MLLPVGVERCPHADGVAIRTASCGFAFLAAGNAHHRESSADHGLARKYLMCQTLSTRFSTVVGAVFDYAINDRSGSKPSIMSYPKRVFMADDQVAALTQPTYCHPSPVRGRR